uniref:Short transient receptor potential channel 7like [Metaseiulus occidentalis] n=1 Tax=Lepeophtheirus salmonis TaxID=72036 RepID=A0A0K2VDJ3_LEPSM
MRRIIAPSPSLDIVPALVVGANLYGVGASLAFLKLIFVFEIHYKFGPILFCMRHVVWDILTVVGSYLISVIAFAVGLVSIFGVYSDESVEHFSDFVSAFKTLFWIIFDPGKEEYADIMEGEWTNTTATDQMISKTLSHKIGLFVWGFYQVFVVLIMLNLLISLMTNTFANIQKNSDTEWKFSRASIWLKHFNDQRSVPGKVPSSLFVIMMDKHNCIVLTITLATYYIVPFNIFPSVYSLQFLVKWLRAKYYKDRNADLYNNAFNILLDHKVNHKIFDPIMERVFTHRTHDHLTSKLTISKNDLGALEKEIEIDVSELRKDVRNLREELISIMTTGKQVYKRFNKRKVPITPYRRRHSITSLSTKLPINVQLPLVAEVASAEDADCSNKLPKEIDENLMEHLVETLGLIGSTPHSSRRIRHKIESQEFPDINRHFI